MLFKPCNSELLVGDAPLPAGAVALLKAASPEVLPVRLAICRFARIGAAPVPPCVPGVVFGDPVVEALPLVKPVPHAAPLPVAESSPPPSIMSMKLMLLDNGEGMLPAIGSTTVGSAVVVPALLKAGPPPWPDCAAADSWSAVSWAHRSFCPSTRMDHVCSPLLTTGMPGHARSRPLLEN